MSQSSKRSFTLGRALALLPLSVLAIAGCAQIIGLDGYSVGSGQSGGTGGGADTGGSGGTVSGAGGKSGSAGKSGSGPSEAGMTSEAGASEGGAAGAPPAGQNVGCDGVTPFSPNENIIRSCILRAGCSPNFTPLRTISECVSKNTQAALPGESCNLASKTCADYEACEHVGIAHDDLCGGTNVTRCDAAGRAIVCGVYQVNQFVDCKAQGLTCATFTNSSGMLIADCEVPLTPATGCAGLSDDTAYYCQAGTSTKPDAYYYCYQNQAYGASCGKFASCFDTTTSGGTPDAGCFFNFAASCTGLPDSATCNAGVSKICSAEDVISYDCSSVGLGCSVKGTDGYCIAPGCKPVTVDNCVESCGDDGTTLTFCYGGVPHSVDCTAYGFSSCMPGTKTNTDGSTLDYAACR